MWYFRFINNFVPDEFGWNVHVEVYSIPSIVPHDNGDVAIAAWTPIWLHILPSVEKFCLKRMKFDEIIFVHLFYIHIPKWICTEWCCNQSHLKMEAFWSLVVRRVKHLCLFDACAWFDAGCMKLKCCWRC